MSLPPRARPGRSDNANEYRRIVLVRVHELLKLGYQRLDRSVCKAAHEEEISGDLADAIDVVLDDRLQQWMDFFSVHNEAPVRDLPRKGKRRRKVDIRIDSAQQRPRTRFPFEAKRLGERHGLREYLGKDGLGCFLRGDYGRGEDVAGMLGYVQSGEPGEWAQSIGRELTQSPGEYWVLEGREWEYAPLVNGLEETYRSTHSRERVETAIDIYHTFLDFS
ncbi:MAG: hypothetical protein ABIP48_04130 [Planctomycetota bacterium]